MNRYIAFLKIVELGSFTKAADILGYTQPAMSQMIVSLENELSIRLLYRSRYGVKLTPEGERLLPSIQSSVAEFQSMQNIAGEIRGLESGVVRIGTISSISCHWLPTVIRQFWEKISECAARCPSGRLYHDPGVGAKRRTGFWFRYSGCRRGHRSALSQVWGTSRLPARSSSPGEESFRYTGRTFCRAVSAAGRRNLQ